MGKIEIVSATSSRLDVNVGVRAGCASGRHPGPVWASVLRVWWDFDHIRMQPWCFPGCARSDQDSQISYSCAAEAGFLAQRHPHVATWCVHSITHLEAQARETTLHAKCLASCLFARETSACFMRRDSARILSCVCRHRTPPAGTGGSGHSFFWHCL